MAVTMRQVTGNMTSVVKGMDKAMETMNLERVRPLPLPPHTPPHLP
jgi:division protein CdvB (Snf7/Vps24/ESCRT-III family)